MNTSRKLLQTRILLIAAIAAILPAVTLGMDTDVYLNAPGVSRDDSPNVLIILDNSGSMQSNSITVTAPYDATVVYAGDPTKLYDANMVYWGTGSTIPASTTSNKFPAANNKCSASLFNLGNTSASATGYYASDMIVGWIWNYTGGATSATKGHWDDLASGSPNKGAGNNPDGKAKMADVECSADNPADATLGAYLDKSTNLFYTNRYTNTASQKITWPTTKPTLYSGNYLNYKNTPGISVTKTRIQIAKEAVNTIINANKNVRFGLIVFNRDNPSPDGGRVVAKVDTMTDARRVWMTNIVNNVVADTYTPLAETLWEAYRYLSGGTVDFGNPNPAQTPSQDLCAQDAACATATGTYISPFTIACQKAYVVIVTDGDPTNDSAADTKIAALPGIGTITGSPMDELAGWMFTHDVYSGLAGNQTVVTYTVGFDTGISASGLALLQSTAQKGGGKYFTATNSSQLVDAMQGAITDALQVTTSFTAPALSVNAFNTLFNRDEVYFAMFKPNSEARWNGNVKKYTLCKDTSAAPTCKYGEIIDANGLPAVDITTLRIKATAQSFWSSATDGDDVALGGAGSHVSAYASRNVYTYTGGFGADGITPTGTLDLSAAANVVSTTNTALTQAMFGVTTATDLANIINWVRGQDVLDENGNGITAEDRAWRFYDPVHSRPVIINYGGTSTSPAMKVFVATNDGMVRMVNENTGVEEWSFIAPEMLAVQQTLATNNVGDHVWGMDGTPGFDIKDQSKDAGGNIVNVPDGIIDPSIGDYVHMYVGMRRGGRNIYAFDVTPTSVITSPSATGAITPKLMWVIRGGVSTGYASLGQTWSQPVPRYIRTLVSGSGTNANTATTRVLFFGGGYDTANDTQIPAPTASMGNSIYIADPTTGARIMMIGGTGSGAELVLPNMYYSIPSDLALMDSNGDGNTDRIYVGDVGGQLWRIDLSPTIKTGSGGGSTGYVFADIACPIGTRPSCTGTSLQSTRRFFYPPDVAQVEDLVYSSANPKYDLVTIASGDREDPIDFLTLNQVPTQGPVHNRIYALRDYTIGAISTGGTMTYPATIKEADLYDATSNTLQGASSAAIAASSIQTSKGWFIRLKDSSGIYVGEKSLARTSIFGGSLYVTTFTPGSAATGAITCAANEGLGTLYVLNILDGAASMDLNGSGTIDSSDRTAHVAGGIPSEHVVVIRPGGNSDLVGTTMTGAVVPNSGFDDRYWYQ